MKIGRVELESPQLLGKFTNLQKLGANLFKLRGNQLLVEKLEVAERVTSGGIVLAHDSDQIRNNVAENDAVMALVLAVGSGYEEDKTDIEVGNVILVPPFSTMWYSTFPGLADLTKEKLGRVIADEVHFIYKDIEAFSKASEILNSDH